MSRLSSRVVKLEVDRPRRKETLYAVVRWHHPFPTVSGFICDRRWGWELRDRLGWGDIDEMIAFVTDEAARPEPEVLVAPQLPDDLADIDAALVDAALTDPGPWWTMTKSGAYVSGFATPNGLRAYCDAKLAEFER